MRKLLLLAALVLVVRRLVGGSATPAERASIGYGDGSAVVLEPGAPGLERLLASAREALAP
jgi:hypothetical protein